MKNSYQNDVLGVYLGQQVDEDHVVDMRKLEKKHKKLSKKRKKGKISPKQYKKKVKKIEKELKRLKKVVVHQKKCSPKYTWWQQTLVDSTPKALELAAMALSQKDAKRKV